MSDERIVVVGAGVVGLSCAYYLAKASVDTIVIDRQQPGDGASRGNMGWVAFAPTVTAPLPGPGVLSTSARWLVQPGAPLRLLPRFDLEYVRWLARFALNCRARTAAAGLRAVEALNSTTSDLLDGLVRDGLDFEMEDVGLLEVYRRPDSFERARRRVEPNGGAAGAVVLSRDEALEAEPLLSGACAGAIRYSVHRHVRPESLTRALVDRLTALGVPLRTSVESTALLTANGRVTHVRAGEEAVGGRTFVLAAGVGIRRLARTAGVRLPVEAGRGYSYDAPREALPLRMPVKLYDDRLALTPFGDVTRIGGMMELGARSTRVRGAALTTMSRAGRRAFRVWPEANGRAAWAGLRPMTPDGLPLIGRVAEFDNLYVAGGHGMLGVTLAARTGFSIARAIRGEADPEAAPFTPARFRRGFAT